MEKIRFRKSEIVYEGITDFVNKHVIVIIFNNNIPTDNEINNGFEILNENNDYVQADYTSFTTVYRTYKNEPRKIEFSDDGSIYESKLVPVLDPEPYEPTPEELEAQFQQNKTNKITLSKSMLAKYLDNNPIHSLAHNNTEGIYSVTSEKQTLMMSQYVTYQIEKTMNPDAKLTWNETGKSCEVWTEEEFLQLIIEIKEYVYPLVSYQQKIEEEILNCSNQEELDRIVINYNSIVA